MPRPRNKLQLLNLSTDNYHRLIAQIHNYSREEQSQEFPPGYLNRNIRDVLMHLHHWHLLMQDWYKVGLTGGKPDIPAKGYTWKTTPDLNRSICEKYQDTDLEEAKTLLASSHAAVQNLINQHNDEELFEKKRYPWTGSTSLGAYFISATSSHYEWARKLIKTSLK